MKIKIAGWVLLLCMGTSSLWAKDRASYVDENYLKEVFTFKANEKLKYAKCPAMYRGKLCFYIWGEKTPEDDLAMLPMPLGKKLRITYEKKGTRTFNMFTKDKEKKDRKDVEFIENLGAKAAWITERHELLVLLDDKRIRGFYLDDPDEADGKEKLVKVAKHILEKEKN